MNTEYKFKHTTIDPYNCTIEELEKEIKRLEFISNQHYGIEQSIKIYTNSCYGALGSPYFPYYNVSLAEAITLQGQDLAKYASGVIDDYFKNYWHLDKELHKLLGLTYANKLNEDTFTIYMDTDSVAADTNINTTSGTKTIESWYNENIKNGSGGNTISGHESVITNDKVLNWNNKLYYAKVKRIIRHKVSKEKWKIKTKSGKEIQITNDHSIIIFRNGEKMEIKPKDINIDTDKILCVK